MVHFPFYMYVFVWDALGRIRFYTRACVLYVIKSWQLEHRLLHNLLQVFALITLFCAIDWTVYSPSMLALFLLSVIVCYSLPGVTTHTIFYLGILYSMHMHIYIGVVIINTSAISILIVKSAWVCRRPVCVVHCTFGSYTFGYFILLGALRYLAEMTEQICLDLSLFCLKGIRQG